MGIFECVILLVVMIAVLAMIDYDPDRERRQEILHELDNLIIDLEMGRDIEEARSKRNRK